MCKTTSVQLSFLIPVARCAAPGYRAPCETRSRPLRSASLKTQHLTQTAPVGEEQNRNQNSFYLTEDIYVGQTDISLRCALLKRRLYQQSPTPTSCARIQQESAGCSPQYLVRAFVWRARVFKNRPQHALLARGGAGGVGGTSTSTIAFPHFVCSRVRSRGRKRHIHAPHEVSTLHSCIFGSAFFKHYSLPERIESLYWYYTDTFMGFV